MKKEITIGQLLAAATTLLIAVITGWITLNNKVSENTSDINTLKNNNDKVEKKLDKIQETQTMILIELQNKKDR